MQVPQIDIHPPDSPPGYPEMTPLTQNSDGTHGRILQRAASMFQEGQGPDPRRLTRMDSMYQAGCQFDKISPPPRVLRKAKSIYNDGFSEAPQSSMLMSRMSSLCQEAKRKARLRRMLTLNSELGEPAHFERTTPSPPRMQNTLHPDDLSGVNISPCMTRAPLTRMSTYCGGSQYEAASPPSYTLRPESSHLSPASSKKVNMFELAHSMEKIRSLEASKLSPELQVRIIKELSYICLVLFFFRETTKH